MARAPKLLAKALAKNKNLRFEEFALLVEAFGFALARSVGSHRIYSHPDVPQPLSLQPLRGKAKPYQIRQFLLYVERYNLKMRGGR